MIEQDYALIPAHVIPLMRRCMYIESNFKQNGLLAALQMRSLHISHFNVLYYENKNRKRRIMGLAWN